MNESFIPRVRVLNEHVHTDWMSVASPYLAITSLLHDLFLVM